MVHCTSGRCVTPFAGAMRLERRFQCLLFQSDAAGRLGVWEMRILIPIYINHAAMLALAEAIRQPSLGRAGSLPQSAAPIAGPGHSRSFATWKASGLCNRRLPDEQSPIALTRSAPPI